MAMSTNHAGRSPSLRAEVEPGSELDRVLGEAEASGHAVELNHNGEVYRLVPVSAHSDEMERAYRLWLVAHTLAIRNRQPSLGTTTAELIREGRGESHE
jgi:hypothetical protein